MIRTIFLSTLFWLTRYHTTRDLSVDALMIMMCDLRPVEGHGTNKCNFKAWYVEGTGAPTYKSTKCTTHFIYCLRVTPLKYSVANHLPLDLRFSSRTLSPIGLIRKSNKLTPNHPSTKILNSKFLNSNMFLLTLVNFLQMMSLRLLCCILCTIYLVSSGNSMFNKRIQKYWLLLSCCQTAFIVDFLKIF